MRVNSLPSKIVNGEWDAKYLEYSCADRAKQKVVCKLYKKCKGSYEDSNKKVNATSWHSQTLCSPVPVQTRGLRVT